MLQGSTGWVFLIGNNFHLHRDKGPDGGRVLDVEQLALDEGQQAGELV